MFKLYFQSVEWDTYKLRHHFKRHRINVPEQPVGVRRHDSPDYSFAIAAGKHPAIQKHFGCLTCPAHFKLLNDLKDHFINDHRESMPPAPQQQESNDDPKQRSRCLNDQNNEEASLG
ncbi:hypothetical protein BDB01DRAFT_900401 [Pilobolus umbonatus]|nr:hypothetical protein BDB01DRAFT_900401 [Pilobolus umbonatus]